MAVEEPKYLAGMKEGNCEVRDYPGQMAAEVSINGERFRAANTGFRILAKYIFGRNDQNKTIAMTAPVVQNSSGGRLIPITKPVTQLADSRGWIVRFGMPHGSSLDSLPTPKDGRVHLISLPPTRFAVAKFSGLASEPEIEKQTLKLRAFIAAHQFQAVGEPSFARYNPP